MDNRKDLKREYKEQGTPMGLLQIRNEANGKVLLETTMNLEGMINRSRFTLKMGSHHVRALQEDWNRQGEADFSFEVLERLEPDAPEAADPKWALKLIEARWLEKLQPYGEKGYHREKRT